MIRIYSQDTTSFTNNGLGILKDALSCKVTEQLNGQYDLTMEYPANGWLASELAVGNIIKSPAGHESGNEQLFRIKTLKRTLKTITVIAPHIFYDLADNFLEDTYPELKDGANALDWLFSHTQYAHDFDTFSDVTNVATARYVRKNVVQALIGTDNCFSNVWGGELLRDNYMVKFLEARGQDRGVQIRYGKNLTEIQWDIDHSQLATRIYPQGYDGLSIPEGFIDSELINNYPHPIVKLYELSDIKVDEENGITEEAAQDQLRNAVYGLYANGVDKPIVNIKVNFIELSKVKEYYEQYSAFESIYLGDTVQAIISHLGLTLTLKIIKTTYDALKGKYESFEIGDVKNDYVTASIDQVNAIVSNNSNNLVNTLNQAKINATEQITMALGGYVYKTNNEIFIMDTDNLQTSQKVWRWNLNGLGYSSTGVGGPYELAMTQDGQIVADMIKTGELDGNLIKAGSITVGQISNEAKADLQSSLLNNVVDIGNNGIEVFNDNSETSTKITKEEFAIYHNGVKVLTVNKDTTVLKKTNIEEDLTVGKIKHIVRTNGLDITYID